MKVRYAKEIPDAFIERYGPIIESLASRHARIISVKTPAGDVDLICDELANPPDLTIWFEREIDGIIAREAL